MAPNLSSGDYKIVTLLEANPLAGISLTGPDFQDVYVGGSVTKARQSCVSIWNAGLTPSTVVGSQARW